ncbi:hypothetical protein PVT67_16135 [Gallaecimonas kandeliae]|uniref:cyclase family protein n=1 Tax=Gallaecimonas kandeliae TaxID=3029055 RepID=UPI00264988FC|nr:cyclase family protein [Gallaecimonas kandeliae]WKE65172.1 hypothetical protein PVT67_16135 [Gallaecimonas kandeliae]
MPYYLGHPCHNQLPALWGEGQPFERQALYRKREGQLPPINYDSHLFKPHSLTHLETSAHIDNAGMTVDAVFSQRASSLFGPCLVLRLQGDGFRSLGNGISHWEVSLAELKAALVPHELPSPLRLLLTVDDYPLDQAGFHDPAKVLTLSEDAARYLVDQCGLVLYGTSWKSSDFKPGAPDRPVHAILFEKALICECLDLRAVPQGRYFLSVAPLNVPGASETMVNPVLYSRQEIAQALAG